MPHRSAQIIITNDEAEYRILRPAGDKGAVALPIGVADDQQTQDAFGRCVIEKDWLVLADIVPHNGTLLRVYKLSAAGRARLDALELIFSPRN